MAQKRLTKTLGEWLDDHGVDRARVAPITSHRDPGFQLCDDPEVGYSKGDATGFVLTHDEWPGWTFELDVAASGGVLSLTIATTPEGRRDGERLNARRLRSIPFSDLVLAARADAAWREYGGVFEDVTDAVLRRSEGGRRGLTDRDLVKAMMVYLDECAAGNSTQEAANRMNVSKSTMHGYRNEARRRGLFESRGPKRPGGQITPKGWAALKEGDE
jgi:hypothetical protein